MLGVLLSSHTILGTLYGIMDRKDIAAKCGNGNPGWYNILVSGREISLKRRGGIGVVDSTLLILSGKERLMVKRYEMTERNVIIVWAA